MVWGVGLTGFRAYKRKELGLGGPKEKNWGLGVQGVGLTRVWGLGIRGLPKPQKCVK